MKNAIVFLLLGFLCCKLVAAGLENSLPSSLGGWKKNDGSQESSSEESKESKESSCSEENGKKGGGKKDGNKKEGGLEDILNIGKGLAKVDVLEKADQVSKSLGGILGKVEGTKSLGLDLNLKKQLKLKD